MKKLKKVLRLLNYILVKGSLWAALFILNSLGEQSLHKEKSG